MAAPLPASAGSTTEESRLLEFVNSARAARGRKPLQLQDHLSRLAQRHSARMANRNRLFHTPCLSCRFRSESWRALAENVGMAGSVRRVHRTMMRSAGHRRNVLGGFDAIGIGVVSRGGRHWVTQIFYA
jgi:uncharacterized protein YkwD